MVKGLFFLCSCPLSMPLGPEDIAREQIDRMLEQAGWAQDTKAVNRSANLPGTLSLHSCAYRRISVEKKRITYPPAVAKVRFPVKKGKIAINAE